MAAHETTFQTRWQEIKAIWKDYRFLWFLPGFFFGFLLGLPLRPPYPPVGWFIDGIWPEVISTIFAVAVINVLYQRFDDRRREKDLQEQLVRDASSLVKDVAVNAVHQMQKRGWLTGDDGLLKGMGLSKANLEGADLEISNLEKARLSYVNLEGAEMGGVNLKEALIFRAELKGAYLYHANLKEANLREANLEGTYLREANLEGANLREANLEGANLVEANLEGVNLANTTFDKNTTLPDGNKWTPNTDLSRFTNRQHRGFWRSDWKYSPAYQGKDDSE